MRIAIDPSFFPLKLAGKEGELFAFTNDLILEVSKRKNVQFERVTMSWDNLLDGLNRSNYQAIISSMEPHVFNENKYAFSDIFLQTGPILIVNDSSQVTQLANLRDSGLGVENDNDAQTVILKYPTIYPRVYASTTTSFEALLEGRVGGALVSVIPAKTYIQNVYHGKVKTLGQPLWNRGLRLITRKQEPDLIALWDDAISSMEQDGTLTTLMHKWGLSVQ